MFRVWASIAVLVAVGLAGCSDSGGAEGDEFDDFGDANVSDSEGVIRGVVVDESVQPLAGATVEVQNTELTAETNENGAFQIVGVEPGTHFLKVSKLGYETVQTNVDVVGGVEKPDVIKVSLPRLPGSEPRFVPYEWDGFIGCSMRRWDPPSGGRGQSCPYVDTLYPDHDFLRDYELSGTPMHVQSNQIWESTQRLGGEMSFNLRRTDTNADTKDIEGTSPLTIDLYPEDIAYHETSGGAPLGGFNETMPLRVIVFTAHLQETEPPTGGWGFGLQLEQSFKVFTHVFYNYAPPESWNFVEDNTVPQPPDQ